MDRVAVQIREDNCSGCSTCSSLCPYDAIKKDAETSKIILDIEKCQVCGLCYSTCPAKAIDIIYYDVDSLVRYLEKAKKEYKTDTLVIMCRGSAPDFAGVGKLFGIKKFIPITVPCIGRVPEEVLLTAIARGIGKIDILACDEDYCRFDSGSSVAVRKVMALNILLEQLGYGKNALTLRQNSLKVKVNADLCIACGNCVFYCPYHAAKLGSPGAVSFDVSLCRGCGLCVALCPALALDLENWEKERISDMVSKMSADMKKPKILVFRCQWAVFPALDNGKLAPNVRVVDLPCASRVDSFHIIEALQNGVDGILVTACSEDDCKQEKAGGQAKHSVEALEKRLNQIGLKDRLRFCTVAPRNPEGFNEELKQFSPKIASIV